MAPFLACLLAACGPAGASADRPPGPPAPDVSSPVVARPDDVLTDVTASAGIDFVHVLADGELTNIVESLGSGAVFLDHDGDGLLDVYLVQTAWLEGVSDGEPPKDPPRNALFRNVGDGRFQDVTDRAGVGDTGFGLAAVAADYDGDGRQDLYVCNAGPNRLYRNLGDGRFEDVTGRAGVGDTGFGLAAVAADYDGDGRQDLYVCNAGPNRLY
ncbi:MAG: FG-GAP repeat domain-containing protein, partial [Planctomycetota bacterium]